MELYQVTLHSPLIELTNVELTRFTSLTMEATGNSKSDDFGLWTSGCDTASVDPTPGDTPSAVRCFLFVGSMDVLFFKKAAEINLTIFDFDRAP